MDTSALFFNFVALSFRRSARPEVIHVKEKESDIFFSKMTIYGLCLFTRKTFLARLNSADKTHTTVVD